MITQPKYRVHSTHLGETIFRRLPNTGTSGGAWLVKSVQFQSLAAAKAHIEYYSQQ
jgi:hypothetical protein